MFSGDDIREVKLKKSYKAGKVLGFGAALTVFSSVFYLILGFLGKMPFEIGYWQMIFFIMTFYLIGLITIGRKKWDL